MTVNERRLLTIIRDCEFHDGAHPVGHGVWTDVVCADFGGTRKASGVMSSLARKGYVVVQGDGRDAIVSLTQAGFDALTAEVR